MGDWRGGIADRWKEDKNIRGKRQKMGRLKWGIRKGAYEDRRTEIGDAKRRRRKITKLKTYLSPILNNCLVASLMPQVQELEKKEILINRFSGKGTKSGKV